MRTTARIVEGNAGKVICKEAERLKPAAVVMGTRGRSLIKRFAFPLTTCYIFLCGCLCFCVTLPFYKMSKLPPCFLALLSSFLYFCSVLQGSVSEYCFHNCKSAPVIIVPGKGTISLIDRILPFLFYYFIYWKFGTTHSFFIYLGRSWR